MKNLRNMSNNRLKATLLAMTLLLGVLLTLAGCAVDETANPNDPNVAPSPSGPIPIPPEPILAGVTYKPFASGHGNKFSLGDFNSPYLVLVEDDSFATAGSRIILDDAAHEITKTDYQGGTYVGIAGFRFSDYTSLISTNDTLTIKVSLVASDGSVIADGAVARGLMVTGATNIYTWQDLQGMTNDLTADYRLRNGITFPTRGSEGLPMEGFEPVGNLSTGFTGSFAGGGYGITNLSIDRLNQVGIWSFVNNANSVIKDFVLDHGGIRGSDNVGGVVGILRLGMVSNVGVVSSRRSNVTSTVGNDVGGLVGENEDGTVNGYVTGDVNGNLNVGGLVGNNAVSFGAMGTVNGYATGDVEGRNDVGGLVGANSGTVNGYATGDVEGNDRVGGLVGDNQAGTVNGYATGEVAGTGVIGGLVGRNANSFGMGIVNGYATGRVSRTGTGAIGGLVGENSGTVNGYWDQASTGQMSSAGGTTAVGISDIDDVVFAPPNRPPNTYWNGSTQVFNNATFLMHFTLPGASATWPILKAESSFLPLSPSSP